MYTSYTHETLAIAIWKLKTTSRTRRTSRTHSRVRYIRNRRDLRPIRRQAVTPGTHVSRSLRDQRLYRTQL